MCPELEDNRQPDRETVLPRKGPQGEALEIVDAGPGRAGEPDLPVPVPGLGLEKAPEWAFYPDPSGLSLAAVHDQAINVTDLTDMDPETEEPLYQWIRVDLEGAMEELAEQIEADGDSLLDLAEDGFDPPDILKGSGPDELRGIELLRDDVAELKEMIEAIRAEKPELAQSATELVEGIEADFAKLEELRESAKEREDEGYMPDVTLNWIRPLPDHVSAETYAQSLADAKESLGFGYNCEVISNRDGDPFLLLSACGMDLSESIVEGYIGMGMCPPCEDAKGYIQTWGHQNAKGLLERGDAKEIERVRCLERACVRSLDCEATQAEWALREAAEHLAMLGDRSHEAGYLADFPRASAPKLLGAIQLAAAEPHRSQEILRSALLEAGPYQHS